MPTPARDRSTILARAVRSFRRSSDVHFASSVKTQAPQDLTAGAGEQKEASRRNLG